MFAITIYPAGHKFYRGYCFIKPPHFLTVYSGRGNYKRKCPFLKHAKSGWGTGHTPCLCYRML
uniref:Uncharacterized protein n=1 Tax=Octopus bimaculoides TaxID=37653 RepID=A0A0L8FKT8_OCTBM